MNCCHRGCTCCCCQQCDACITIDGLRRQLEQLEERHALVLASERALRRTIDRIIAEDPSVLTRRPYA